VAWYRRSCLRRSPKTKAPNQSQAMTRHTPRRATAAPRWFAAALLAAAAVATALPALFSSATAWRILP